MSGVTEPGGTARAARQDFPVWGKTGTTNDSTNAWFIGYAPFDRPTVAMAVVYEEKPGLLGSQDAAVAARAVFGARFGVP